MPAWLTPLRDTVSRWSEHKDARLGAADVEVLRDLGFDDVAIHDAVQVIAYFNYINRVADCLGVDLEPDMRRPQQP